VEHCLANAASEADDTYAIVKGEGVNALDDILRRWVGEFLFQNSFGSGGEDGCMCLAVEQGEIMLLDSGVIIFRCQMVIATTEVAHDDWNWTCPSKCACVLLILVFVVLLKEVRM